MLGTTFGGNYLASVASLAVLEVLESEKLMENAFALGESWMADLNQLPNAQNVRGRGLMIGFDLPEHKSDVRRNLLMKHHIFTGEAKPHTIRLLPSLAVSADEIALFMAAIAKELS